MSKNLLDRLLGRNKTPAADSAAVKKEKTLATINESATTAEKPARVRRTVGLTEQRLRARNQQSWMTSTKGWSAFFGRFTRPAER